MSNEHESSDAKLQLIPSGPGAAALLAAGLGAFLLAVLAMATDQSAVLKGLMNFYRPSGPLSGVTTVTIVLWLAIWLVLHLRWRKRMVSLERVRTAALVLLALGFLLTFPPLADLF